ncbi:MULTISPECIES: 3-oxoacyl-ACP reductase FabG [Halobacteriovorax]|uniref:3-oxoacyl-ACP reductase FabG n=1 Tax=Halobacteriovorax TaxID=1652133 RepID=UPI000EB62B8E|nr:MULTISPECIES: 3-oxoacyl-ACP reductase FabG [Halobacteriovorax]AYF43491.1 KR domain protein [Halobacteriovorax sp. BALOs_7]
MIATYNDLKNKKVLITGASRGIGLEIAKSLATQGAHVVFNYREGKEEVAKEVEAKLKELGASNVTGLMFDLNNEEQMKTAVNDFTKEYGPLEGLVNNAGVSKDSLILRTRKADLDAIIDTNLKGAIMLTSICSRGFLKAENVSIVNISSIVGLMGNISQTAYSASKAGLIGATKSVAKELASRNIRCNAICPGFIETDMTDSLEEKAKEAYIASIPTSRFGSTEDVSNLVCFLLSQASGYITGEVIKIDGGLYI